VPEHYLAKHCGGLKRNKPKQLATFKFQRQVTKVAPIRSLKFFLVKEAGRRLDPGVGSWERPEGSGGE